MKALREWIGKLWHAGIGGKLLVAAGAFVFFCVICSACLFIWSFTPQYREVTVQETATAQAVAQATNVTAVTATERVRPTDTPIPTNTSAPAATPPPINMSLPTNMPLATTSAPTAAGVSATETPRPTDLPTHVPTEIPSPTKITGLLPGLQPADVKVNLEDRQFTCSSVNQGELYFSWICKRTGANYELNVQIYGRTLLTVDYIVAMALQFGDPSDEVAAAFLGFMATMPYDGAHQEEARAWVEEALPTLRGQGDLRKKTFGGVEYQLFGIPTARTLKIGDLK